ncbi:MAG: hypothetical protein M3066_19025 [Actinomycetota bacterium]|nr:hypothetical protein [Actinomycetota bacterium]
MAARSVDDTARVLDITPTRVYAIFRQVGRKLGLAPSEVRTVLMRGEFQPIEGLGHMPVATGQPLQSA